MNGSDPELAPRPTVSRPAPAHRLRLHRHLFYYVVVGGLTVVVDIGLLALLHEVFGVPLVVATTVAYCTAVTMNFLLNRSVSSRSSQGLTRHALRYGSLVAANYVLNVAVVTTAGHLAGDGYLVAKAAVVAASTSWNFLLYRHWVFTPTRPTSSQQEPNSQLLTVVPAHVDDDSDGSSGDRRGRPEDLLGCSCADGQHDPGHERQA